MKRLVTPLIVATVLIVTVAVIAVVLHVTSTPSDMSGSSAVAATTTAWTTTTTVSSSTTTTSTTTHTASTTSSTTASLIVTTTTTTQTPETVLTTTAVQTPTTLPVTTMAPTTTYTTTTTATLPPTTTTTLNLTGPDGTQPGCSSTPVTFPTTTTTGGVVSGNEVDLLTTATVGTGDTVSVLAGPYEDMGFCADCYSKNGGVIAVVPSNGYSWDLSTYRYLHITVNTNMPFTIMMMDHSNVINSGTSLWFAEEMNSDESLIAKGAYVAVIDLHERYQAYLGYVPQMVSISKLEIQLYNAGSISVGHLALSSEAVCGELPPSIQTTTFPSFPGSGTTTTTTAA